MRWGKRTPTETARIGDDGGVDVFAIAATVDAVADCVLQSCSVCCEFSLNTPIRLGASNVYFVILRIGICFSISRISMQSR